MLLDIIWVKIVKNDYTNFSVAGTEKMRITTSGNVGIGTDTPNSTLQVNWYLQITTMSYSPLSASDCDQVEEVGRMRIWSSNSSTHKICFCPQDLWQGYSWVCK